MTIFNKETIRVKEIISEHLVFRDSVSDLFSHIKNDKRSQIVLDFSDVKSISRSFAQEYMQQKEKQFPLLHEKNMDPQIKKMFIAVKKHQKKMFPLSFGDAKEVSLNSLIKQNKKGSIK